MPDQGRVVEREYTTAERTVLNNAILTLGAAAIDVYLNGPRLLAQRPRRRVELPTWLLPGSQEMVVLPREQGPGPPAVAQRGATLH